MDDGPHIEGANETAQPANKVVRLPRDWLGPHEELVPFGRRPGPPPVEDSGPDPSQSPPNAEDFWGERSAAVQVPASAEDSASGGESAAPAPWFGSGRRRLAAASVLAVAAATVAVVVLSGGAVHQIAGGAKLNLAAILSSGVSRGLTIGPRIVSATHAGQVRHTSRRAAATKPVWHVSRHHGNPAAPAPTYAARATPASVEPTYRTNVTVSSSHAGTSPTPARPSHSAAASVSPTGQSGALGPVQSPNG